MDVVKDLKRSFKLVGIDEENNKFAITVYIYLLCYSLITANVLWFLIENWDTLDDRINALKALLFLSTFAAYAVSIRFGWAEFSSTVHILNETGNVFPYKVSKERKILVESFKKDAKKFNTCWSIMVIVHFVSTVILPGLMMLINMVFSFDQFHKTVKHCQSAPFPIHYPKLLENVRGYDFNIWIYMIGYITHSFYTVFSCGYIHIANVTPLCALNNVQYELRQLRLSLYEMNKFISESNLGNHHHDGIKCFLKYFVHHHQYCYRKFNTVNKGIRWVATIISTEASIYMCMSIYTITQKQEFVMKIQEGTFFIVWAVAVFFLDVSGERIKTEHENLRTALYEVAWTNKPKWFKSFVLTSMIRNTKEIDVKSFGVVSLNLKSFALTMNAAYSYYNLLRKSRT